MIALQGSSEDEFIEVLSKAFLLLKLSFCLKVIWAGQKRYAEKVVSIYTVFISKNEKCFNILGWLLYLFNALKT